MKAFLVCLAILLIGGTIVFLGLQTVFGNPADKAFAQNIAGQLSDVAAAQARAIEAQSNAAIELTHLNAQLVQAQLDNQRADIVMKYAAIVALIALVIIAIVTAVIAVGTYRTWKAGKEASAPAGQHNGGQP